VKKFAGQLPDAMELVAGGARARRALGCRRMHVSPRKCRPDCKEFGRVYEEQNLASR